MSYKINDKIMGISTDMLGIRIVSGKIIDIIEADSVLYRPRRLIIEKETGSKDTIYEAEATEYDGFKLMQAKLFYEEVERLERKIEEYRKSAKTTIYTKGSK